MAPWFSQRKSTVSASPEDTNESLWEDIIPPVKRRCVRKFGSGQTVSSRGDGDIGCLISGPLLDQRLAYGQSPQSRHLGSCRAGRQRSLGRAWFRSAALADAVRAPRWIPRADGPDVALQSAVPPRAACHFR